MCGKNGAYRKIPASQIEMQVSPALNFRYLMDWQNDCPKEQQIEVEPVFYHLTFSGEQPKFAMKEKLSDEEYDELLDKPSIIYIHINRLETVPESKWKGGVPFMYWAYEEE